MEERQELKSIRDFLGTLFKHKKKIVAIFLLVALVGIAVCFMFPSIYQAKATVLVKYGREYIYRPEVGDKNSGVSGINPGEAMLYTEIQILRSKDLIKKVITTMGVQNLYPKADLTLPAPGITREDAAIPLFEEDLTVDIAPKSNVIEISYRHRDPVMAARVANLLVDYFKDKHLQVYRSPKSSFLEGQVADFQQKLDDSAKKLASFKQTHKVYSPDEQRALLLKQRTELDAGLKGVQNTIRELEEKANAKRVVPAVPMADARTKLLELQMKEEELVSKYNDNSRVVLNLRKEIEMTKAFIKQQDEENKDQARTELNAQMAKAESFSRQIQQLDGQIRELDAKDKEFRELQRNVASNEKSFTSYLEKYEEAQFSEDLDRMKMSNVSVVELAAVPVKPIKPNRVKMIAIVMALSIFLSIGSAYFCEQTGQSLSSPASVEKKLGTRVLATVPMKG